uniref:Matrix protein n=1 Tax=Tioman virus TaxID=162013 RepID=A0A2L2PA95_9MONO|nr:matrix protein [Tioman virus]
MALRQATIPINVDTESEKNNLNPFPIVPITKEDGSPTGRLVKQLRIKNLTPRGSTELPLTFINTYGFIKPLMTYTEFYSELHHQSSTPCLTACMIPFGAGPFIENPHRILDECDRVNIVVRKSASVKEEIIFDVRRLPPLFNRHQISGNRLICVPSEKYVKSPGKMIAGTDYAYQIAFVSLTFCPESQKFRVARPLQTIRSPIMRSVQLEVILKIDCAANSPLKRFLIISPDSKDCFASVWFHICNLYRGNKPFKAYDDTYFSQKCRAMQLECGIVDMWGPTLVVKAHGKIPKMARPFFSSKGWSCHAFADAAPTLARALWSVGAQITQVNAILQPSDLHQLVQISDVIWPKVKLDEKIQSYAAAKWNPFKKSTN